MYIYNIIILFSYVLLLQSGTGAAAQEQEVHQQQLTVQKVSNAVNVTELDSSTSSTGGLERIFSLFFNTDNYNSPLKNSIRFYLFTHNRTGSEELVIGSGWTLRKSHYDPRASLKILIHGYKRNAFSDFPHIVKDAYLREVEGAETAISTAATSKNNKSTVLSVNYYPNVVCVDWRRGAGEALYLNSAYNTRLVGERVGDFIIYLKDNGYLLSIDQVHLVGFSLGAQVAGYAGKYIFSIKNSKIQRITGLDPAGPAFTGPHHKDRLDRSDARFVDVIHTSIWKSGLATSVGHVDFFPNKGEDQPGCYLENIVDPFLGGCSHVRSVELYTESVRGVRMYGCRCGNWEDYSRGLCDCGQESNLGLLGEYCDPRTTQNGNYFLKTDSAPPYALPSHPTYNTTAAFNHFIKNLNSKLNYTL